MGAQLRAVRARIRAVKSIAKITRALELIAASRMVKAQQRVAGSSRTPRELTRAVSAVASRSDDRPPADDRARDHTRAAALLITSDRGSAGAYSSNVLREGEPLTALMRENGFETVTYMVGRKGLACYRFRDRVDREGVERVLRSPPTPTPRRSPTR